MFPAGNEIAGLSQEPLYLGKLQQVVSPLLSRFCYSCRTFAQKMRSQNARRPREHGVACPSPGGEPLYKMAALSVASRRLPGMTQRTVLPIASVLLRGCCGDTAAHRTAAPRDVPGSRLLLTHRAAMLRSGSPPGLGHATLCSLGRRERRPHGELQPTLSPIYWFNEITSIDLTCRIQRAGCVSPGMTIRYGAALSGNGSPSCLSARMIVRSLNSGSNSANAKTTV